MLTMAHHYDNCGYGVYCRTHSEINDGQYHVFVLGVVPITEIEELLENESVLTGAILDDLEYLETIWKIYGGL